jgi:hypothetical protein
MGVKAVLGRKPLSVSDNAICYDQIISLIICKNRASKAASISKASGVACPTVKPDRAWC